jgi:uncharacterized protein (DUF2384 family)
MAAEVTFEHLIKRQAEQVFGSKAKADAWLAYPRVAFGGLAALECARDETGYLRVKSELERIDHGLAC